MNKLVVWICNGVVALMSLLAILCYFFAPVWKIKVKYPLSAAQIQEMVSSSLSGYDITIEQDAEINLDLNFDMGLLFSSVGSDGDAVVEKIVDKNVHKIAVQLKGTIGDITHTVAKQYAKQVVKDQVHAQLKSILGTEDSERITQKLEAAGIGEEYLSQKTDALFDLILSGETNVDRITDEVMDTVDEVYSKLKSSGDEDFKDIQLTDGDKASIKDTVSDALGDFASTDGTINMDEYINKFLTEALRDMNSSKAEGIVLLSAVQTDSNDELTNEIGNTILNYIPSEIGPILSILMTMILVVILISMASWIYILVKLIVKLVKYSSSDPTVRLKLPIILGWLPFLLLVIVPAIAMPFVIKMLGEELAGLAISFASISWIALMSAAVCLGISIFYMILRKKEKSEIAVAVSEEETESSKEQE